MKIGLLNKSSLFRKAGLGAIIRFFVNLDTWHKNITNVDFAESINNLPAKLLPAVGKSNGTSEKLTWIPSISSNFSTWSVAFRMDNYQALNTFGFIIGGDALKNILLKNTGVERIAFRDSAGTFIPWDDIANSISAYTYEVIDKYSTLVFYSDGTNIHLILDGNSKGYITPATTALYFSSFILGYVDNTLGADGNFWDLRFWLSNIGETEALKYHLDIMTITPTNWFPDVESGIDIVGDNHATTNNLDKEYIEYDTFYKLKYGFQNFNTQADGLGAILQVPYRINKIKIFDIALGATQAISGTTYYLISENPSVLPNHNMSDCLVDFLGLDYWMGKTNPILMDVFPAIVGETYKIYNDEICYVNIGETDKLEYIWTCDIGSYDLLGFNISPLVGNIGDHAISLLVTRNGQEIASVSGNLKVLAGGNGTGTKTILVVGDSLVTGEVIVSTIRNGLTGITADMVGTQGSGLDLHEGRAGWTYANFVTSGSPFWNGGAMDVNNYRAVTLGLGAPIDYVIIQLGINSMTTDNISVNYVNTTVLANLKALVDAFIADGTGKILIACSPKCDNTGVSWSVFPGDSRDQNYYLEKMQAHHSDIKSNFDDVIYDASVLAIQPVLNLNRLNYPVDDGLHPKINGSIELGKGHVANIETLL